MKAPAAAMPDAADRLAAAAAELQLLDAARQTIRRSAAQVLAIPDDAVTVSVVAAALPAASAAELRAGQRRLRELGEQTAALARQSSAVLACGRSFTRRLLAELLGIADAQRYGPSGQRLESSTAGLVQGAL